ncbi:MAG: ribonuclease HI family protein [Lactobacillaceae bacterium]|jgi:ribonuclease HI|nr:ribonuclease HI family protein [Lactobacillaceae bacterium]
MLIKLYTDAATKNAQGPSAAGVLIVIDGQQHQAHFYLGDNLTNHEAEFMAATLGFKQALALAQSTDTVFFYTDSRVVSDSLGKGHAKHYPELLAELEAASNQFELVMVHWVPEKANLGAHNLAFQELGKYI